MHEAMYYEKIGEGKVKCTLCRHRCIIRNSNTGICRVRKNIDGKLYSLNYGKLISMHIDPIEKKPLFHFLPGKDALSIATVGCNFACKFCQNWEIAQFPALTGRIEGEDYTASQVVSMAQKYKAPVIAYTYTEPTIFYEFALDVALKAQDLGIKNVFITNGYIEEKPLKEISPFLHAANIDLKGWNKKFYASVIGARRDEVLKSIVYYKKLGIWVEITTLLIEGKNDKDNELQNIAKFIYNELGADTPWHISRFFPAYKMQNIPPTSLVNLKRAFNIGKEVGLRYIYIGNMWEVDENTYCPKCGALLIERRGFSVIQNNIHDGKCPVCGTKIAGVW